MAMNPMIYPGMKSKKDLIIETCMDFLGVDSLNDQTDAVVGCKRLIVFLLQEFYPGETLKWYGSVVGVTYSSVSTYRSNYSHMYYGKSLIYTFLLLTIKAKIESRFYFELKDLYKSASKKMSLKFTDKRMILGHMSSKQYYQGQMRNDGVKAFCLFFLKEQMTPNEIKSLIKFSGNSQIIRDIELENKKLYLSIIKLTVEKFIDKLKQQDEKR